MRLSETIDVLRHDGYRRLSRELNKRYYRMRNPDGYNRYGIDIFKESWDNCIILDACRYDMFEEYNTFPGTLETRISRGSQTKEFLKGNLNGKRLHDTVYITANPQYQKFKSEIDVEFHDIVDVWDGEWDENLKTVPPESMTKRAKQAAKSYPNKRLLIHYLQPHYPFIRSNQEFDKLGHMHDDSPNLWRMKMANKIDISNAEIWNQYNTNLEITLPHVSDLIDTLDGRSVITADHGNMVGERSRPIPIKDWGHPPSLYTKELIQVPWLVLPKNGPKEIIKETPANEQTNTEEKVIESRLSDLGYL